MKEEISGYLASIPEPKQSDMRKLHSAVVAMNPRCKLWFVDGKDESGKVVSNPSIGYGSFRRKYADGKTKEFYRAGISANSAGLSVYIMGLQDKMYLHTTYAGRIGKAKITGYCIKFKALEDIDLRTLLEAIQHGLDYSGMSST